jgi:hypothetical protein
MPADRNAISCDNTWVRTVCTDAIPWIWEGVIAENAITLLSAPEKTGKSTLVSLLLDRRRQGGPLLGRTVRPGRTILCSEEHRLLWALRQPPLDFGPQLEYHNPIGGNPTPRKWRRRCHRCGVPLPGFDVCHRPDAYRGRSGDVLV